MLGLFNRFIPMHWILTLILLKIIKITTVKKVMPLSCIIKIQQLQKTVHSFIKLNKETWIHASEFGNGFCISPKSTVVDGKMELVLLSKFSWFRTIGVLSRFFMKRIEGSNYIQIKPFEKVRITLEDPLAHYDGEPFYVRNEINIQVVPKSLMVLAGKYK